MIGSAPKGGKVDGDASKSYEMVHLESPLERPQRTHFSLLSVYGG